MESQVVSELVSVNTRLQQKDEGGVEKIDKTSKNQFFSRVVKSNLRLVTSNSIQLARQLRIT